MQLTSVEWGIGERSPRIALDVAEKSCFEPRSSLNIGAVTYLYIDSRVDKQPAERVVREGEGKRVSLRQRLRGLLPPRTTEKPKEEVGVDQEKEPATVYPIKVERSIAGEEARVAKEELKSLNVEKEIISYALTRLYEAEAEGKITKEERMRLVDKYKGEMKALEKLMEKKQLLVDLHELEETQSQLVNMFYEKFEEIGKKVQGMRASLGLHAEKAASSIEQSALKPLQEPSKPKETKPAEEEREPTRPKRPPKTEADKRIEAIQEEVLKVLERLEQIETEA